MNDDRRNLDRIPNSYDTNLRAMLSISGEEIEVQIIDYNSSAVSLFLPTNMNANSSLHIHRIIIKFGSVNICVIQNPILVSFDNQTRKLVLLLKTPSLEVPLARSHRSDVSDSMQGTLIGKDPIKFNELLHFKLVEISPEGFLGVCSRSNRHLTPGTKLDNFDFILPGAGLIKGSAVVKHISVKNSKMYCGCEFVNLEKEQQRIIKGYYFSNMTSSEINDTKHSRRFADVSLRDFIRIERVTEGRRMDDVLKIRFESYREANKISESVKTYEDMRDEYDANAVVIAAFLGVKMVGTIRIVFDVNGSKFPFESLFAFPTGVERNDLTEVSKLAILPEYQGSNIVLKLFQAFAIEYIPKKRYSLCMATKKLAKYYTAIGAKKISSSIPHPTINGETLTCYLFDRNRIISGRMRATSWYLFARDVIEFLSKFGFTKKPTFSTRLFIMKKIEQFFIYVKSLY